ncbi:MAG: hypothetical protein ACREFY_10170 [Acetobacteraceae bacterium]
MHGPKIALACLAAGILVLAPCAPAGASLVQGTLAGTITSGPDAGQEVSLAVSFDEDPTTGAFAIASAADEAVASVGGVPLLSVPAYVMDGSLPPGSVAYGADAVSGQFDLTLTYNFQMRSPGAADTQSRVILSGSSPIPLISAAGIVDPGFFQAFVGSGSGTSLSSGLALLAAPAFYQTQLAFSFDVGVPEPSALALLAVGSLLTLGLGAPHRARRRHR